MSDLICGIVRFPCNMFTIFMLLIGISVSSGEYVKPLTVSVYSKLKSSPALQVIHFHKGLSLEPDPDEEEKINMGIAESRERHVIRLFNKQFEASAQALTPYGINLYSANCMKEDIVEYCHKEDTGNTVYIMRQGTEMLSLGLDSMFDQDAIMSNVLQIALMQEVPILQTPQERVEYENKYKKLYDVIFSFQLAIGTSEHRSFMEVAYAYKSLFKFAISTDKRTAVGLPGVPEDTESALWLLQCKSINKPTTTTPPKPCPVARYYGTMNKNDLTSFMLDIQMPNMPNMTEKDNIDALAGNNLHQVLVFHDGESSGYVQEEGRKLAIKFRGTISVVFIDVEHVQTKYDEMLKSHNIPALGFKTHSQEEVVFMPDELEPEDFILQQLGGETGQRWRSINKISIDNNIDRKKILSEVEIQDDEVAQQISRLRGQPVESDALLILDKDKFPKLIASADVLIVLFHLPFDAMSAAFYRTFAVAAEKLQMENKSQPLAALNCYDWTDICDNHNVTMWPEVRVYRQQHDVKTHNIIASPDNLLKVVSLYMLPSVITLESEEQFKQVISGKIPGSDLLVDSVVVFDLQHKSDSDSSLMKEVAASLHGQIPVCLRYTELKNKISEMSDVALSTVVLYKLRDVFQPRMVTLLRGMTPDSLKTWIEQSSLDVFPELTPMTLPKLYGRGPILIYFTPRPDNSYSETAQILGRVAASGEFDKLIFTWMDIEKDVTRQIKTAYTGEYSQQDLVVVNLAEGQVFAYGEDMESVAMIKKWLLAVTNEELEPTTTLPKGDWKPKVRPYDFLSMMKDESQDQNLELPHEILGSDMMKAGQHDLMEDRFGHIPQEQVYMSPTEFEEFKLKHGIRDDYDGQMSDTQIEQLKMLIEKQEQQRDMKKNSKHAPDSFKHIEL